MRSTAIIADDDADVHPLLRRILEREFEVLEGAFDGQTLLDAVNHLHPDLVVVDVFLPILDGIQAVKRLKAQSSPVSVVFISTDGGEETMQRALKTGALGYVWKPSAAEDLLAAARAALKGQRFVSDHPS